MTLDRRLETGRSICPVRPPKVAVKVTETARTRMRQERHFAAHPEDRGATLVVFLRKILGGDA
jgi:hypothetical protein